MIPTPSVRKVDPLEPRCRCGATTDLILDDGPAVCRGCIREAGVMGEATVRRSDTPTSHRDRARRELEKAREILEADHRNREGWA